MTQDLLSWKNASGWSSMLQEWLLEAWTHWQPIVKEVELLELPWQDRDEEIRKLGTVGLLEYIYFLKWEKPPPDDLY